MGSVKQNDPMGYHYPRCRKYLRRITQEVIEMVENPPRSRRVLEKTEDNPQAHQQPLKEAVKRNVQLLDQTKQIAA